MTRISASIMGLHVGANSRTMPAQGYLIAIKQRDLTQHFFGIECYRFQRVLRSDHGYR